MLKSISQEFERVKPKTLTHWLLFGTVFALAIVIAIKEARTEDTHGDFYIFWSAGLNFWQGNALYSQVGGAEEFLYPPFAPMLFQIFALTPFPYATFFFTLLNFGLWIGSFYAVALILQFYFPQQKINTFVGLTAAITIRFFWHNIIWVNINELTLTCTLWGILFYLRKKETASIVCFCIGIWLKVMPALLLLALLIKGTKKTWLKAFFIGLMPVVLIFLQRGFTQASKDFIDFYHIVLHPFSQGKVYTEWISFSISSMLFKLLTAHPPVPGTSITYNISDLPVGQVRLFSMVAQILVFTIVFGRILYSRFRQKQEHISLREWVSVLLSMLLLAGVAWEGHHVTMVLVYPALFLMLITEQKQKIYWLMLAFCFIINLLTLDLIGAKFYHLAQGFSILTYLIMFLFVLTTLSKDIFAKQEV